MAQRLTFKPRHTTQDRRRRYPLPHGCLLACTTSGVVRERVGDILVQGEAGAQILVDPQMVEHFEATLTQVGTGLE